MKIALYGHHTLAALILCAAAVKDARANPMQRADQYFTSDQVERGLDAVIVFDGRPAAPAIAAAYEQVKVPVITIPDSTDEEVIRSSEGFRQLTALLGITTAPATAREVPSAEPTYRGLQIVPDGHVVPAHVTDGSECWCHYVAGTFAWRAAYEGSGSVGSEAGTSGDGNESTASDTTSESAKAPPELTLASDGSVPATGAPTDPPSTPSTPPAGNPPNRRGRGAGGSSSS